MYKTVTKMKLFCFLFIVCLNKIIIIKKIISKYYWKKDRVEPKKKFNTFSLPPTNNTNNSQKFRPWIRQLI